MDPILLIGGGALALIALNSAKQTATSGPGALPFSVLPKSNKAYTGEMLNNGVLSNDAETVDLLSDTYSYADYRYVEVALASLGYNVANIPISDINACVYRVSVYQWYYGFQAIVKSDETLALSTSGAYGVIDEWIQTFGHVKIAGVPWNKATERNKLVNYDSKLKQGYYIGGDVELEDGLTYAVQAGGAAASGNWIQLVSAAFQFMQDINWFGPDHDIADGLGEYLLQYNMDQSTVDSIVEAINYGRLYWDAAVEMHIYLVNYPTTLPEFTPVYKY